MFFFTKFYLDRKCAARAVRGLLAGRLGSGDFPAMPRGKAADDRNAASLPMRGKTLGTYLFFGGEDLPIPSVP